MGRPPTCSLAPPLPLNRVGERGFCRGSLGLHCLVPSLEAPQGSERTVLRCALGIYPHDSGGSA